MNNTVLITGISGFLAGHLARALAAEEGTRVVGTGRSAPSPGVAASGVLFSPLDIRDFDATLALLREESPSVIYHLAAISVLRSATDEGGARTMLDTNVAGTWNVLEAARQAGVETVIVASSDKQYGALAVPPYDDEDSTAFENGGLYELSKAQQDQVARLYTGLYEAPRVRVARLVNLYGPGDLQWTRIVPGTIRRTVLGEAPRLTAGKAGEALREYVYVDDAVTALRALAGDAVERGNEPVRRPDGKLARAAYNIGPGTRLAAGGVIELVQRVLREDFGVEGPAPVVQPGTPGVFEPGSQFNRTEKLAGLIPGFIPRSMEDGLRQTLPWYLDYLKAEG